jgi:protein-S-isoprenylcysteine O-methyltransferase Ste14
MTEVPHSAAPAHRAPLPARLLVFVYGVAAYLFFFAVFLWFILFTGGLFLPKTVDAGAWISTPLPWLANLALIALFGVQHSVMARQGFKRRWTRIVPEPAERSTYVLASAIVLAVVMAIWQPMPATVWSVTQPLAHWGLWALFGLGWAVLLAATFMTDHFDLFGLRQVWLHLRGRPYTPVDFEARWLYRHMRHPLYSGFLLAFWATPEMSAGHLILALGMTGYILAGTRLEERDLHAVFGERYARYAAKMPRYMPRLRPWTPGE